MTEIMPVPRILILLSYQQGALGGLLMLQFIHSFAELLQKARGLFVAQHEQEEEQGDSGKAILSPFQITVSPACDTQMLRHFILRQILLFPKSARTFREKISGQCFILIHEIRHPFSTVLDRFSGNLIHAGSTLPCSALPL